MLKARIRPARTAFIQPRNMWNTNDLRMQTKIRINVK